MEDVAGSGAQHGLHAGLERGQLFVGDKGLDGTGKAAAVDADGASALQQFASHRQGQGNRLLPGIGNGPGVLQVKGGRDAGGIEQGQEGVEIARARASASAMALRSSS